MVKPKHFSQCRANHNWAIILGQLNQSMAYRSRRYFVWKLGPTGTCANKVLGDDDSAILRQPLLVTLTFLITGSRCRRASSTLCVLVSLDDLTGIEKHGRNERVVELEISNCLKLS